MTILETFIKLRDDLKLWVANNLKTKANASDLTAHNSATDVHSNMGWLTSEDTVVSEPTPLDADTLGGHDAAYFDTQIAVERARINTFVALPEGSTIIDSELEDIRVGYDSTTYETAGEAVRQQIADANEKLNTIATFEEVPVEIDPSEFEPVNVIDDIAWTTEAYWGDNGVLVSNQYTAQYTSLSELIPVVPNATYQAISFSGTIKIYNGQKALITSHSRNTLNGNWIFTAGADAAYMGVICTHKIPLENGYTQDTWQVLRLTPTEGEGVEYQLRAVMPAVEELREATLPLHGKVIVNFGDSIFGLARPPYDISTVIANRTKATVHNCGFGGCCMAKHPTTSYDAFSMYRLATAIANNDFALQDANASASGMPSYFVETLNLLKSIDFSKVDIVTISYGTNDFTAANPVDSANYPRNNGIFAGALRNSIETLQTAYPNLRIFLLTPCYRFWSDENGDFLSDVTDKAFTQSWDGSTKQKLGDFATKIKEVAQEYFLPVIDNYNVGIGKFNRKQYFPSNDSTHHNQAGRNLLGEFIAKQLY